MCFTDKIQMTKMFLKKKIKKKGLTSRKGIIEQLEQAKQQKTKQIITKCEEIAQKYKDGKVNGFFFV